MNIFDIETKEDMLKFLKDKGNSYRSSIGLPYINNIGWGHYIVLPIIVKIATHYFKVRVVKEPKYGDYISKISSKIHKNTFTEFKDGKCDLGYYNRYYVRKNKNCKWQEHLAELEGTHWVYDYNLLKTELEKISHKHDNSKLESNLLLCVNTSFNLNL